MHIESYYLEKRIELGQAHKEKLRVFLDTNFWIRLRDASRRVDGGVGEKLLRLARSGVEAGRLIFPVSREILIEIFAQSDSESLLCSADLIDELSGGVCIVPEDERKELELLSQFSEIEKNEMPDISNIVWTKTPYDSGLIFGPSHGLKDEDVYSSQVEAINNMWNKTVRDRIEYLRYDKDRASPKFPDVSDVLNSQKNLQIDNFKSWRDIYLSEVVSDLDNCKEIVESLIAKEHISIDGIGDCEKLIDGVVNDIQSYVYKKINSQVGLNKLSTIHIPATIVAAVCWDKKRKFKKNDWLDYQHATVGLAYCDVFFTEKPLSALICRAGMQMDDLYNSTVSSTIECACEVLESKS